MSHGGQPLIHRRELEEVLYALDEPDFRGVLLLGGPGSGKTSLLRVVERELDGLDRGTFYVSLRELRDPGDLPVLVVEAIDRSRAGDAMRTERAVRSSAEGPSFQDATEVLRKASRRLRSPVLLLDGLDEAAYPQM